MAGQTANDALNLIKDEYKHRPVSATSTEGIYATLDFLQAQISELADYIDGKRTETKVTPPAKAQMATATPTPAPAWADRTVSA